MKEVKEGDVLVVINPASDHVFGIWKPEGTLHYTFKVGDFLIVERVHKFGINGFHVSAGLRAHLGWAFIDATFDLVE